ncbi:MAG: S-methyl-5'-thioadenosine phosphorylase [Thaumarchaeota archaeon]|nr:S-methyl-5'-thioadenosine phosphorylase [Nitrososphaerota archaeon]
MARIAVIGGTGLYSLLEDAEEKVVETPYGPPSSPISLGSISGIEVAFIPRHGRRHEYPPHMVPYRANLWALKQLGVERVIAPAAVGSLKPEIKPGDFVICDQFVNFAFGRKSTFYDGPITTHLGMADPYCPELRGIAIEVARELGIEVHEKGTVVVIEGPRFSTRAESEFFRRMGWDVINMTQYPEVVLARELGMCYVNISLVTDYDTGLKGDPSVKPVSHKQVIVTFNRNLPKLKKLLYEMIPRIPEERGCGCEEALREARQP